MKNITEYFYLNVTADFENDVLINDGFLKNRKQNLFRNHVHYESKSTILLNFPN